MINPVITITVIDAVIDIDGRFIILNVNCNDTLFELINIYGHNVDKVSLFLKLESYISKHGWDSIVWGGDFNFVMNLNLDKVGGNAQTNFKARNRVLGMMETYDLIDTCCERNPCRNQYTWHSNIARLSTVG